MNFKDKIYEHYISLHNEHLYGRPSLEQFRAKFPANEYYLRTHLPAGAKQVLDIGCGDGNLVYWLQETGYPHAAGVDISAEQINAGLTLGVKNLYQADLSAFLKERSGSFDIIIARDVFEHFTRDAFLDALFLIKASLSENGRLIVQLPNGEGIHASSILYGDVTHECAYVASSLRQLALCAGFKEVTVFPVNPGNAGLKGKLRMALWTLKTWQVKFWRYIERGNPGGPVTANLLAVIQ